MKVTRKLARLGTEHSRNNALHQLSLTNRTQELDDSSVEKEI